jgi:hypothetical protein
MRKEVEIQPMLLGRETCQLMTSGRRIHRASTDGSAFAVLPLPFAPSPFVNRTCRAEGSVLRRSLHFAAPL